MWLIDGKTVLEVKIPESKTKPHFATDERGKWIAYMRVNDENLKANRVLLAVWKGKTINKATYLRYGKEEKALIEYLKENREISFSKFMKITRTGPIQAEHILSELVLMEVLEMDINKHTVNFKPKFDDTSRRTAAEDADKIKLKLG